MYFLHEKFLALTRNEVIEGRRYIGELMKEIERSNEEFIACYYDKILCPCFSSIVDDLRSRVNGNIE